MDLCPPMRESPPMHWLPLRCPRYRTDHDLPVLAEKRKQHHASLPRMAPAQHQLTTAQLELEAAVSS